MSIPVAARLVRRVFHGPLADDRVGGVVLVVAIAVALLCVPIAVFIGSETYQTNSAASVEQLRTRHASTATLVEDAPLAVAGAQPHHVTASWTAPDGGPREGAVPAAPNVKAGSPVAIRMDASGLITTHPLTTEGAVITVVGRKAWWAAVIAISLVGPIAYFGFGRKASQSPWWTNIRTSR